MKRFLLAALVLALPLPALAQDLPTPGSVAVSVLKDPTTYIPAGLYYVAARGDWGSSQTLFAKGDSELNGRYIKNGVPISEAAGNSMILVDAVEFAGMSAANNAAAHTVAALLAAKHPEHRKLYAALSTVERLGFAAALSYTMAAPHFSQWELNVTFINRKW